MKLDLYGKSVSFILFKSPDKPVLPASQIVYPLSPLGGTSGGVHEAI